MKHTSYLDGIRPLARFRWSLGMLAPRFEVQSVCFMIYGFLTLERPCREASLKLHSFKGIESFKKQNRNCAEEPPTATELQRGLLTNTSDTHVCSFHLSSRFVLDC